MASVGTYVPLPPGPHPFNLIGLDIDDGSLYPEQAGEFEVLLDFEIKRKDQPNYREVQLEALRLSRVKYRILKGSYSRADIRGIYRKTGALFLGHSEAFGLPICEVQACGGKVFMPDPHWAAAHWLGDDYYSRREPRLTSNFVVYENEPTILAKILRDEASKFDPHTVRRMFISEQPQLFRGDRDEVRRFLDDVENGEIHSKLHREHRSIGRPVAAMR